MAIDLIKKFHEEFKRRPWFVSASVVLDPKNGRHIRLIYNKEKLGTDVLPTAFEGAPVVSTHKAIYKAR